MTKIISRLNKIYIGDPCYALSNEDYEIWGSKFNYADGKHEIDGNEFAVFSTEFGDGSYEGSDGRMYPVDSGTIGAIPFELVSKEIENLGRIVETDSLDFECQNGEFYIKWNGGSLNINTSYIEDEDDEIEEDDI